MSTRYPYSRVVGQGDSGASKATKHHLLRPRLTQKGKGVADSERDGEEVVEQFCGINKGLEGGDKGNEIDSEGWILVNIGEEDGEDVNFKELADEEQSPLYVHAKQYHRILIRRAARQRLEEYLRVTWKDRKRYLHETRHGQCRRRPRHPNGRFLTAEEIVEREQSKGIQDGVVGITVGISEAGLEEKT